MVEQYIEISYWWIDILAIITIHRILFTFVNTYPYIDEDLIFGDKIHFKGYKMGVFGMYQSLLFFLYIIIRWNVFCTYHIRDGVKIT